MVVQNTPKILVVAVWRLALASVTFVYEIRRIAYPSLKREPSFKPKPPHLARRCQTTMGIPATEATVLSACQFLNRFSCGSASIEERGISLKETISERYSDSSHVQSTPSLSPSNRSTLIMTSSSLENSSILDRLADFEDKGWIDRHKYLKYRQKLLQNRSEANRRLVNTELDQIANRFESQSPPSSDVEVYSDASSNPPSILQKSKSNNTTSTSRHVSWEDQSSDVSDDKENMNEEVSVQVMEPSDLWTGAAKMTEQQIQELFVEMCFFARLGYVQPPCCLQCTYRESMDKASERQCTRWVVWRKNAQNLLHPNRLDGNIMIVRCCVARSLLEGKPIEGRRWDASSKQIVVAR